MNFAATIGCGEDQQSEDAIALYDRIQQESYQSFERAPGYEMREPSDAPHNDYVDIFINDEMVDALTFIETLTLWPLGRGVFDRKAPKSIDLI